MNAIITRTIQPVGQGGFYTELFEIENSNNSASKSTYCVVYDCGSKTESEPQNTISSAIPDGMEIDILFISHFDDDHVNGITELMNNHHIKIVVMPQIQNYEWYYVIEDSIRNIRRLPRGKLISELIQTISESGAKIIEIAPFNSGENEINRQDVPIEEVPIERIDNNRKILGNSPMLLPFSNRINWMYIPINTSDLQKINLLRNELNTTFKNNLSNFTDFDSLTGSDCARVITEKREEINNIYKSVFGDSNKSSMCLYSGLSSYTYNNIVHFECGCSACRKCRRRRYYHSYYEEACLYTGDANLTDDTLIIHIKKVLGKHLNRVGLMQIPHHGSNKSSSLEAFDSLYESGIKPLLFASFGTKNGYHHPSYYLFGKLLTSNYSIFRVTEQKDTGLIESIHIH